MRNENPSQSQADVTAPTAPRSEPIIIRTAVRAGGGREQHSQALQIRTRVRAGFQPGELQQHSQALEVRTRVRAGFLPGERNQHSQALEVRTRVRAGLDGVILNHSQAVAQAG